MVEGAPKGSREPVPARKLPDETFQILASPGLVEGIAAGDVVRVLDHVLGTFEVVLRGGNVSIKIISPGSIQPLIKRLQEDFERIGGWIDGKIERAAVFTVPVKVGFRPMEELMARIIAAFPGLVWYYGNVYGADGVTPLKWWDF
jgi:hypothetical protein